MNENFALRILLIEKVFQLYFRLRQPLCIAKWVFAEQSFAICGDMEVDRLQQGGLSRIVPAGNEVDALQRLDLQIAEAAEVLNGQGGNHRWRYQSAIISSGETVATPTLRTTQAAAWLATTAASSTAAPIASPSVNALITVSPAPAAS